MDGRRFAQTESDGGGRLTVGVWHVVTAVGASVSEVVDSSIRCWIFRGRLVAP